MRICVVFRADYHEGQPVPAYPWSYVEAFREMGHEVEVCGEGHPLSTDTHLGTDFLLEIENGRNQKGELRFQVPGLGLHGRTAVLLYDTHGHPDLHAEIAKSYGHVFFGSWVKRDVFAGHPSAHWCPSATDLRWFGAERFAQVVPEVDVGFFGSKKGLARADELVSVCKARGWTYDVRQIGRPSNPHRWPATGACMARCRVLFNQGQKHDSPNLRCIESMAMGRPLVSNLDPDSGMHKLFVPYEDYFPYTDAATLQLALNTLLRTESAARAIAYRVMQKVAAQHLVKHRAAQILEVVTA